MFPNRYFPVTYFTAVYWPNVGHVAPYRVRPESADTLYYTTESSSSYSSRPEGSDGLYPTVDSIR